MSIIQPPQTFPIYVSYSDVERNNLVNYSTQLEQTISSLDVTRNNVKKLIKNMDSARRTNDKAQIKERQRLRKEAIKQRRLQNKERAKETCPFFKPVRVSLSMCVFANWRNDNLHSRIDVTKTIFSYIKNNNLKNPLNNKQFIVDQKLSELLSTDNLKLEANTPMNYIGFQKYMKGLFL